MKALNPPNPLHLLLPVVLLFLQAQEPPAKQDTLSPKGRKALVELRQGKEVARNVELLRGEVDAAADPGTLAFDVGVTLLTEGRPAQAQPFLAIARERRPQDGVVALQLGKCCTALNLHVEGLEALTAAEQLLPAGPRPLLQEYLSMVLTGLQRGEEAEQRARRAIDELRAWNATAPADKQLEAAEFDLNLANVHQQFLRQDEALAVVDAVAPSEPTMKPATRARYWLARAKALDAKGDEAGAAKAFARQRELAPQDAKGAYEFGLFHMKRGRHAEARPLLESATTLDPDLEGALFSLAHAQNRLGDKEAAKQTMARYQQALNARIESETRLKELRERLQRQAPAGK